MEFFVQRKCEMLKSLRNENLFTKYIVSFPLSLPLHAFSTLSFCWKHTCTMNFNFTLHFLESYFQFNRKYLFEVILHFFSFHRDVLRVFSVESFFMYSPWLSSSCLHLLKQKIWETYRLSSEEQVNIRIWS